MSSTCWQRNEFFVVARITFENNIKLTFLQFLSAYDIDKHWRSVLNLSKLIGFSNYLQLLRLKLH